MNFNQLKTETDKRNFLNSHGKVVGKSSVINGSIPFLWELKKPLKVFKKTYSKNWNDEHIVNLVIPVGSLVAFSTYSRVGKMRSDRAVVHSIININDEKELVRSHSGHSSSFVYTPSTYTTVDAALSGKTVPIDKCIVPKYAFSRVDDVCASGIHFYLRINEAKNH